MLIDQDKCTGCGICVDYCPGKAILETHNNQIIIDEDLCFECGVCSVSIPCPTDAFYPSEDNYQRGIRAFFSNPRKVHDKTLVPGRGTEEVKTNDVTGRYADGEVGFCIEFGRPVPGCTFKDISDVARQLIKQGITLEKMNPLTSLMVNESGMFPEELENERILSAILEIKCKEQEVVGLFNKVKEIISSSHMVISIGIISFYQEAKIKQLEKKLEECGAPILNVKGNYGLGRPLFS